MSEDARMVDVGSQTDAAYSGAPGSHGRDDPMEGVGESVFALGEPAQSALLGGFDSAYTQGPMGAFGPPGSGTPNLNRSGTTATDPSPNQSTIFSPPGVRRHMFSPGTRRPGESQGRLPTRELDFNALGTSIPGVVVNTGTSFDGNNPLAQNATQLSRSTSSPALRNLRSPLTLAHAATFPAVPLGASPARSPHGSKRVVASPIGFLAEDEAGQPIGLRSPSFRQWSPAPAASPRMSMPPSPGMGRASRAPAEGFVYIPIDEDAEFVQEESTATGEGTVAAAPTPASPEILVVHEYIEGDLIYATEGTVLQADQHGWQLDQRDQWSTVSFAQRDPPRYLQRFWTQGLTGVHPLWVCPNCLWYILCPVFPSPYHHHHEHYVPSPYDCSECVDYLARDHFATCTVRRAATATASAAAPYAMPRHDPHAVGWFATYGAASARYSQLQSVPTSDTTALGLFNRLNLSEDDLCARFRSLEWTQCYQMGDGWFRTIY